MNVYVLELHVPSFLLRLKLGCEDTTLFKCRVIIFKLLLCIVEVTVVLTYHDLLLCHTHLIIFLSSYFC